VRKSKGGNREGPLLDVGGLEVALDGHEEIAHEAA